MRSTGKSAAPAILACALFLSLSPGLQAQKAQIKWTEQEKPLMDEIKGLRQLPDDVRANTTKQLALRIRQLPATDNRLLLANTLASRATEGDFGHDTLQEVATTLAAALRDTPVAPERNQPAMPYQELAQLVRYEGVKASLEDAQFATALANLEELDQRRAAADFTLTDLTGHSWSLSELRGKVVLVNFWATWCSPCRKEMPDLDALYQRFKDQGLVVLAITDEESEKVRQFLAGKNFTYAILLDPGRTVHDRYQIEGIPKSFVYDRSGKLVAQSIDMRTRKQFLEMLRRAGLQ